MKSGLVLDKRHQRHVGRPRLGAPSCPDSVRVGRNRHGMCVRRYRSTHEGVSVRCYYSSTARMGMGLLDAGRRQFAVLTGLRPRRGSVSVAVSIVRTVCTGLQITVAVPATRACGEAVTVATGPGYCASYAVGPSGSGGYGDGR